MSFFNFFHNHMVQKYQNEISPTIYYGISTKTNEKDLKIPNLQLPDWKHPYWMTLYICFITLFQMVWRTTTRSRAAHTRSGSPSPSWSWSPCWRRRPAETRGNNCDGEWWCHLQLVKYICLCNDDSQWRWVEVLVRTVVWVVSVLLHREVDKHQRDIANTIEMPAWADSVLLGGPKLLMLTTV